MDDIKAMVIKNDLSLPDEKVQSLLSALNKKTASYLSPEKEPGPFLLYSCGDDLPTIATKTNYPLDVIYLTAIRYNWPQKGKLLQKSLTEQGLTELQKELAKSLLVATYIGLQKELADVIAGRISINDCGFLPKNMNGIEKLMNMITNLIKTEPGSANNVITAQNVQINQIVKKDEDSDILKERALMAEELKKI